MKKHLGFILFFSAIISIFLGKFILMKGTFLYGDYLNQFYPWSKIYSAAIKNLSFPFWTHYVNSGFPLMAEGQLGGFYPLNILAYFFLPFDIAYNYSIVLHFILGGIFTYLYARKLGACQWGGSLSALLFCFGSSFAGCPYLRTLVWFPLGLFVIEKYFAEKKTIFSLYLGAILGLGLLAGSVQVAIYCAGFYLLYFIYGLTIRKNLKIKDILTICLAFIFAAILFSPQVILTFKMAGLSLRTQSTAGFALWGSFNPLNLLSLYLPSLIFYGSQLYVGIFSLIFVLFALGFLKKEIKLKPVFVVFLTAIFLALGGYNPIYVFLLKITRLYSFRNPSKFIFFAGFALAVLSGVGFSKFFESKDKNLKNRILNVFSLLTASILIIFSLAKMALYVFKDKIIDVGSWYVTNFVFGKSHHRYNIENYLERVRVFYDQMVFAVSSSDPFILFSLLLSMSALWVARILSKNEKVNNFQKAFIIGLISADIFVFSFYGAGFTGNIKSYDYLTPTHSKILSVLRADKDLFRIMPFGLVNKNMPWWVHPSANILVGLDSVASYTPLAQKSYRAALAPFEVVDDSLGLLYPDAKALADNYITLCLLNVKYIIAPEKLDYGFLKKVLTENGIYLYRVRGYLPRAFFVPSLEAGMKINENADIKIIKYTNGYLELDADCLSAGFVVFSENAYPGWKVFVDGNEGKILEVKNLIQTVKVEKGRHKIIFRYAPF